MLNITKLTALGAMRTCQRTPSIRKIDIITAKQPVVTRHNAATGPVTWQEHSAGWLVHRPPKGPGQEHVKDDTNTEDVCFESTPTSGNF